MKSIILSLFLFFLSCNTQASLEPELDRNWTAVNLEEAIVTPPAVTQQAEPYVHHAPMLYGSIQESCTPENIKILILAIASGTIIAGGGSALYWWFGY